MTSTERFFQLLEQYPFLRPYWNKQKGECDLQGLIARLGTMSTGEVVIAKVVLSIWNPAQAQPVDITDLAAVDARTRRPIVEWLASPFWP